MSLSAIWARYSYSRRLLGAWLLPMLAGSFECHADQRVPLAEKIQQYCAECPVKMQTLTGSYILEYGEEALLSRAWLTAHASQTIDVQYFIWSTDNIGILAGEALLSAAERGVQIRVLVDDLLVDAEDKTLLALSAHPNVSIRIYNPQHSVGVSFLRKLRNVLTDFRGANQRMHDKTVIFDNLLGITGGRNMADEYFDYNGDYNFRDRDILLLGPAVGDMTANFEEFWSSALAVPVEQLINAETVKLSSPQVTAHYAELHRYAADPANFEPEVRLALSRMAKVFPTLAGELVWDDVYFFSDIPGKNLERGLGGGGESTQFLLDKLNAATHSVVIQSPYLVMDDAATELFQGLIQRGVEVKISTNSLASTDNLMAFSGYQNIRDRLLEIGVQIFEYRPKPASQHKLIRRFPRLEERAPVFAIHAKSMVIDSRQLFIGTFNLDPRSANLNTEVGVFIDNPELAKKLEHAIFRDMDSDNSWRVSLRDNPDGEVVWTKRLKVFLMGLLPLTPVL